MRSIDIPPEIDAFCRSRRRADVSNQQLALQFFLQLTVILLACRLVGGLMRVHRPTEGDRRDDRRRSARAFAARADRAVGAGGAVSRRHRSACSSVVSQLGLVLYMFVVGTHLQTDFIKRAFRGAMLISLAGIIVPFVLGAALASFLTPTAGSLRRACRAGRA